MRFDFYHPAINMMFFAFAVATTIGFNHPVLVVASCAVAIVYTGMLRGAKGIFTTLILLLLAAIWTLWYSSYTHFGLTNLGTNIFGNSITLESVVYGGVLGVKAVACVLWLSCFFEIVSSDKIIYLLGRISPALSLYVSIALRWIPRLAETAKRINEAQQGIGRGVNQGSVPRRLRNALDIAGALVMWMMDAPMQSGESMRCRGYSLKGRTAFGIYRFDNRDRGLVIVMAVGCAFAVMTAMLGYATILYDPAIVMAEATPLMYVFYVVYALMLLLPIGLQAIDRRPRGPDTTGMCEVGRCIFT